MNTFDEKNEDLTTSEIPEETTAVEGQRKVTLSEMLQIELKRLAETAVQLKRKIDNAKTDYKKKYFRKKLKKNNDDAMRVLVALQRVAVKKQVDEPTSEK